MVSYCLKVQKVFDAQANAENAAAKRTAKNAEELGISVEKYNSLSYSQRSRLRKKLGIPSEVEKNAQRCGLTLKEYNSLSSCEREKLRKKKQEYKIEQADDLISQNQSLSIYKNGEFWDLCEGPHVNSTKEIPKNCFCLDSLAGAYWKGSEKNKMMQKYYIW